MQHADPSQNSPGANNATLIEASLRDRRQRVGLIALGCLIVSGLAFLAGYSEAVWTAAGIRIGIVLGAIWLVLPETRRPAVWSKLTRGRLAVIVLVAVFINRLKFLLPLLLIAGVAAWLIRPKKRTSNGRR